MPIASLLYVETSQANCGLEEGTPTGDDLKLESVLDRGASIQWSKYFHW